MRLSDMRDLIDSFNIAETVYMGKLPDKQHQSFGVYLSKHSHAYQTAIGGPSLQSFGVKYITVLIHWDKSPRQSEDVAEDLFQKLLQIREKTINDQTIKFIQPLYSEPIPVGTDDAGVYEFVIEMAVIYERTGKE